MTNAHVRCLLAGLILLAGSGCGSVPRPPSNFQPPDLEALARSAIRRMLEAQAAAWNRGDLEGFMAGYARTDSLRFASGGAVQRGRQAALDAYRRGYPDEAAMGTLSFTDVDVDLLCEDRALVFGRWRLRREEDAPHGLFTLIVAQHPTDDGPAWRIIHDHTSAAHP